MEAHTGESSKFALITGASSGIGEATALRLATEKFGLLLTARRQDRLESLAKRCLELGAKSVPVRKLDVSDRSQVDDFFSDPKLLPLFSKMHVLVNNAGLAKGVDKMSSASMDDWQVMLDTNVVGLLAVTRQALPHIIKNRGHIVNLGSVAGRWSYPGGAVYSATKAAVRAVTEGLRMDVQGTGVRVTNIAPGMVETEFSDVRLGDEAAAKKIYEGMTPLSAADIADCICWSLSRPAHVNIQEMIVFPTDQAGIGYVHRG